MGLLSVIIALASPLLLSARQLSFSYVLSTSVEPVYGVSLESTVPAVDLALQHINQNTQYNLTYNTVQRDEVCERSIEKENVASLYYVRNCCPTLTKQYTGFGCSYRPTDASYLPSSYRHSPSTRNIIRLGSHL